jgi:hypothetical protein
MDNVQNCDSYINILSSLAYGSSLRVFGMYSASYLLFCTRHVQTHYQWVIIW